MIGVFIAGRTEDLAAVGAAHSALCHVFSCLFSQKISLVVFLLVIDLRRSNLEVVSAITLNHAGLHVKIQLHSHAFNLLFIILRTENLSHFHLWHYDVAVAAFGVFKDWIAFALALVLEAHFFRICFEATNVVSVVALCLHKHPDVACHLILWRDRRIAVLAHGAGFFRIECHFLNFFLLLVIRRWSLMPLGLKWLELGLRLHCLGLHRLMEDVGLHQILRLLLLWLLHRDDWPGLDLNWVLLLNWLLVRQQL